MTIGVVANERQKEELLAQGIDDSTRIIWLDEPTTLQDTDCYIDLLFSPGAYPEELKTLPGKLWIINSVESTLDKLPSGFIRINGWNSFLKRSLVEAACHNEAVKEKAENVFFALNKKIEWVPDMPGFISARIVASVINEAYFALEENVSSKEEIDTAMKLGTNYPYGPFEWSKIIGLKNIYGLLSVLSQTSNRYKPAELLKKEALS